MFYLNAKLILKMERTLKQKRKMITKKTQKSVFTKTKKKLV